MDYFVLACEILFIVFTVYYTVEEVLEVCEDSLREKVSLTKNHLDQTLSISLFQNHLEYSRCFNHLDFLHLRCLQCLPSNQSRTNSR